MGQGLVYCRGYLSWDRSLYVVEGAYYGTGPYML